MIQQHKGSLIFQLHMEPMVHLAQHLHLRAVLSHGNHRGFPVVDGIELGVAGIAASVQRSGGQGVGALVHQIMQGHPAVNAQFKAVAADGDLGPVGLAFFAVPALAGAAFYHLLNHDRRAVEVDAHGAAQVVGGGAGEQAGSGCVLGVHPCGLRIVQLGIAFQRQHAAAQQRGCQQGSAQNEACLAFALIHNRKNPFLHSVFSSVKGCAELGSGLHLPPDDTDDGFRIEAPLLLRGIACDVAVTGGLLTVAQPAAQRKHHRVEPVHGSAQQQRCLHQQILAPVMGQLVAQYQCKFVGCEGFIRQIDGRVKQTYQHGAGNGGADVHRHVVRKAHFRLGMGQCLQIVIGGTGHPPAVQGTHEPVMLPQWPPKHPDGTRQPCPAQQAHPADKAGGRKHSPICREGR